MKQQVIVVDVLKFGVLRRLIFVDNFLEFYRRHVYLTGILSTS